MNFLSVLYAKAGITVDGVTTLNNTATALTPATNDNSTKIATTAFVKNQNYYPYPTGTTAQYVRGDGSLATFTQTGGGGSSVSYYLNGGTSQGTIGGNTYYEMSKTAVIGTAADFNLNADGYIAQFVTDAGDPALLSIPGGNWNFEMFFSASSGGGSPSFYVELYKYDGTTLTLISSGSTNPESITNGTATDLYLTSLAVPTTTLTLTDRLAIRVYVTHSGRTITLHTQNGHLCQVITSFTTGLTALNGLTAQVQNFAVGAGGSDFNISSVTDTHTFNLPTASATKRGALSSIDWSAFDAKVDFGDLSATAPLNYNGSGLFTIAQSSGSTNGYLSSTDWNTFNNKQNALTLTTTGTSGAATLVGGVLNIPQYQAVLTNPVTGTGTTGYITKWVSGSAVGNSIIIESGGGIGIGMSPSYTLDVNGTARIGTALTINGTSEASTALTIRQSASLAIALAMSNRNQNHTWGFVVDTAVVDDKNFGIYNITNSNFPLVINATTNAATFSSSVTASSLIKSGGTSTQYLMADGSTSTLTNPITGTGTTNYLPKFTGTSALGNSNLINDANGQLGLGVTPSPWSSSLVRAFQIGNLGASISSYTALNTSNPWMFMDNNAYNDGTNDKYILSKAAARYVQVLNEHRWLNAPTGTAGDTISFTQAMTLDANGRLAVGSTSPTTRFEVYGGHNDTTARLYSTGNNSTLNASLDMWASEPGVSYDGSGIGNNVNGSPFYGRRNSALGQSYIRFISGQIIFYTGTTTANPYLTIAASGVSTFTSSVNATSFTANNRTILTSGGLYDNATNGNNIGIGFGASVLISTDGAGTYSAQNLGNATYPWYSAYFASTITATNFIGAGTGLTGTASGLSIGGDAGSVGGIAASRIVYGGVGARQGVTQITDWNQSSFPNAAFLSSEGSIANAPTTDFTYGVQTSFHRSGPDYRTQFVTSLYGNNVYWLRQLRDTAGWSSWVQVIHSGNIGSQSVSSAVTLTSTQGNWSSTGVISNVVGLLAWKNYNNNHVIFDASQGTSPSGGVVDQTNSTNAWVASFPTLMGWNGVSTYGVRVDSARVADGLTSMNISQFTNNSGYITSSALADYLPLAAGISYPLTGTLYGVGASFSSAVTASSLSATSVSSSTGFIATAAGGGLRNDFYDVRFYPSAGNIWNITGATLGGSSFALRFLDAYNAGSGAVKAQIFWSASNVGLFNDQNDWVIKANQGSSFGGTLYGAWIVTGSITAAANSVISGAVNSAYGLSVTNTGTTNAAGLYVNLGASATGVPFRVDKNGSALFDLTNAGNATIKGALTISGSNLYINSSAADISSRYNNGTNNYGWLLSTGTGNFSLFDYNSEAVYMQINPSTFSSNFYYANFNINVSNTSGGSITFKAAAAANNWSISKNDTTGLSINKNGVSQLGISATGATTLIGSLSVTGDYISVGSKGLYSSTDIAYFRRNDVSNFCPWLIDGAKSGNDYKGTLYNVTNFPHMMFNATGGGLYYQTGGRWVIYYDYTANCLAIGGSGVDATYKLRVTGAIYATGAIVANSDGRNKENVEVVENALEKVTNLRGVTYTKKDEDSGRREMGVIAQEVEPHVPEVVHYSKGVDVYGVSYGNFAGLFIEAIKEQQVLINELKAEIEILKNK